MYVAVFCCFFFFLLFLVFFYLSVSSVDPSWRRCFSMATFLVHFVPSFFSDRVSGLVWLGSAYLVTTTGSVADLLG